MQLSANFFYIIIRLKVFILRSSLRLWAKQKDLFVRASKAHKTWRLLCWQ
ncbi:hypothetical protein GXM_04540 [Nostoc sphaeroides CCNUC1]|uniref:Uncharacterized protein n=1 Tax=Nostoc sphaeroides CCNUC1 TaxID=2653204 RepID=A0A5P8W4X3_9NOSO|nr:hypothetical protein GXM_04540 [Nostoc sphaeroides CCNUC1]